MSSVSASTAMSLTLMNQKAELNQNSDDEDLKTMNIPISEEKSGRRTSSIIMIDNEPDVNITIKTALEENGDFKVDAESALFAFKSGMIWQF
jgi:hypothetical protein